MAEEHESRGLEGDELPAELAADRAAGTGDEDRFASGHRRDRREIGLDRIAAEQVFDLDFANGDDADAVGEDLEQAGHGARLETRGVGGAHHFTNDGARGAGHGDDELFGAPLPVDALEVSKPAEHGDAGELEPVLGAVVVDEADRFDAELGVGEELLEDHLAGGAGTGDEGAADVAPASTLRPSAPAGHTRKEARGGEDEDGKEAVAEEDAKRDARGREVAREYYKTEESICYCYGRARQADELELGDGCIPPEAAVHAEGEADGEGEGKLELGEGQRSSELCRAPMPTLESEGVYQERCDAEEE